MIVKARPLSSKPHSQTNIFIDNWDNQSEVNPFIKNKQKFNYIIPEMPAFPNTKTSSTTLLYSKFIMKGMKNDKIGLVKDHFKFKKDSIKKDKIVSLRELKSIKSTINTEQKNTIQNNLDLKQQYYKHFQQVEGQFLNQSKILELEIKNFFKIPSKRAKSKYQKNQQQASLLRSPSQNILNRPKTATNSPTKQNKLVRVQTAKNRILGFQNKNSNEGNLKQFIPLIPQNNILKICDSDRNSIGYKDYIKRNKRQLSSCSKKNSIYLTGIDQNTKINGKDIKKLSGKKLSERKQHKKNKSQPQMQIEDFKIANLTQIQKQIITRKNEENLEFMKNNMPQQYKKFNNYLLKQNDVQYQNELLSKPLEQLKQQESIQGTNKNTTRDQNQTFEIAKQYFQQYVHLCEETEYFIKRNLKKQQKKEHNQVLDVFKCQAIVQINKQRMMIINNKSKAQELKQLNLKIFDLVKNLVFFNSKSSQVSLKIFELPFQIISYQQNRQIIKCNDLIKDLYIILTGSVKKEVKIAQLQVQTDNNNQKNEYLNDNNNLKTNSMTIFDGYTFGQPSNTNMKVHDRTITSLQPVLLMKVCYSQYKKIYLQTENISDRINILRSIFSRNKNSSQNLADQDLQMIAFQLQTNNYNSKQIIFRKGEICDKLIIIASGKVAIATQHILKRNKKINKDLKYKSFRNKKQNCNSYNISEIRRKNLKNYQVLQQNQKQIVYYYQNIQKEYSKSDTLNWEGFSTSFINFQNQLLIQTKAKTNKIQQKQFSNQKDQGSLQFNLGYSIISNSDNVKIYTLQFDSIRHLPEYVKNSIISKAEEGKNMEKKNQIKTQHNIKKWDSYKQKQCNQIIKRKLKN